MLGVGIRKEPKAVNAKANTITNAISSINTRFFILMIVLSLI